MESIVFINVSPFKFKPIRSSLILGLNGDVTSN
jgi:hypothetical protein